MQYKGRIIFGSLTLILICVVFYLRYISDFSATSSRYAEIESSLTTDSERGVAYFAYGDLQALSDETINTSAVPWKLLVAALLLNKNQGDIDQLTLDDLPLVFREFGLLWPTDIKNWPEAIKTPTNTSPLGINVGLASKPLSPVSLTIANMGCATCHAGVIYDENGLPNPDELWLGMPNSSINLEAYVQTIFDSFKKYASDETGSEEKSGKLLKAVNKLYPDISWQEKITLKYLIIPRLTKLIDERDAQYGRLLPYKLSLAGATNGLDAFKNQLGLLPTFGDAMKQQKSNESLQSQSLFNSIPELGGRVWRNSFLNTGAYHIPITAGGVDSSNLITKVDIDQQHLDQLASITAYFSVPSSGISPEVAESNIDDVKTIFTWMANYEPLAFPGNISDKVIPNGRQVYEQSCASCHGVYDEDLISPKLVSFPNWKGDVGTDSKRAYSFTQTLADTINNSDFGDYIDAQVTNNYFAPPLTGLWSSAPYLHNGSVPTLWHLMNPNLRPDWFFVGGHRLDMNFVGLAGRETTDKGWDLLPDYQPWATPVRIDTTAYGMGNQGHETEFETLDDNVKKALLEYLKLL